MSLFDAILAGKLTGGGGGGSLPKPIPYDYMPEGYPKVEMGDVTVLEEQTITIGPTEGNQYIAMLPAFTLAVGKTYNVVYDGMSYQCVGIDYSTLVPNMPYEGVMLGNASAILGQTVPGNNDDAPFVAASLPGFPQYCVFALSADQVGDHTFAIYEETEVITPIAEKFLPRVPIIISESGDESSPYTASISFDEAFGVSPAVLQERLRLGDVVGGASCIGASLDLTSTWGSHIIMKFVKFSANSSKVVTETVTYLIWTKNSIRKLTTS